MLFCLPNPIYNFVDVRHNHRAEHGRPGPIQVQVSGCPAADSLGSDPMVGGLSTALHSMSPKYTTCSRTQLFITYLGDDLAKTHIDLLYTFPARFCTRLQSTVTYSPLVLCCSRWPLTTLLDTIKH